MELFVADQVAGVVESRRIRDTGQEQLGPMVVDHGGGPGSEPRRYLGQVVPHGHQLDAMASGGARQRVEVGDRCDVGGLVEHHQQGRVERLAGPGHLVVGTVEDGAQHADEQRGEPTLVMGRGAQVEGVGPGQQRAGIKLRRPPRGGAGERLQQGFDRGDDRAALALLFGEG